jgi:pyridoxamine 5'-phosphate oxidase
MDQTLTESNLLPDPIELFTRWYDDVKERNVELYDAMTLATADASGIPSARMLLLKGFDTNGFVFYTNYTSIKARELEQNPRACIVFYWKEVDRQVRIWGNVEKVSRQESEAYFKTRSYDSQLGAWASHQSAVIPGREILEKRFNELRNKYPEGDVPPPEFWGGYRVQPEAVEFWQGRPSRLHDRIKYTKKENEWEIVRLAP